MFTHKFERIDVLDRYNVDEDSHSRSERASHAALTYRWPNRMTTMSSAQCHALTELLKQTLC